MHGWIACRRAWTDEAGRTDLPSVTPLVAGATAGMSTYRSEFEEYKFVRRTRSLGTPGLRKNGKERMEAGQDGDCWLLSVAELSLFSENHTTRTVDPFSPYS